MELVHRDPEKEGEVALIEEDGRVFVRGKTWYSKRRPGVALGFDIKETPLKVVK